MYTAPCPLFVPKLPLTELCQTTTIVAKMVFATTYTFLSTERTLEISHRLWHKCWNLLDMCNWDLWVLQGYTWVYIPTLHAKTVPRLKIANLDELRLVSIWQKFAILWRFANPAVLAAGSCCRLNGYRPRRLHYCYSCRQCSPLLLLLQVCRIYFCCRHKSCCCRCFCCHGLQSTAAVCL